LNAQHLLYEAQIGHHYGLEEDLAIASLTSVPAHALGLDHRIGYVRVGYDADLVIWDSHPLTLGATPIQVFIDGVPIFDENTTAHKLRKEAGNQPIPPKREFDEVEAFSPEQRRKDLVKNDFVATGIRTAYIRDEHGLQSISALGEPLTMVVQNGKIICLSSSCSDEVNIAISRGSQVRHFQNGYILPGLTVFAPALGLSEIDAEKSTQDGPVDTSKDPTNAENVCYAKDGLTFDGKHLERAQDAGVLNVITAPLSRGFLQGVSVAFKAGARNVLQKDAIIQEQAALHFAIGHQAQGGSTPSISSQVALLRKILVNSANKTDTIYGRAANGKIPLAISTQNKDVIAHLLKMKASLADIAPINLVIIGGIESYLLAEDLAKARVPIILVPWRCQPEAWEYRHCLPGPPISDKTSFQILVEHGVEIALGAWDDGLVSTLYWEAAWAAKGTDLKEKDVVGLISTKVEKIFGINWDNATDGGHVLFEGNPLDFGASVAAIIH
jgi:Amidohydrolase family